MMKKLLGIFVTLVSFVALLYLLAPTIVLLAWGPPPPPPSCPSCTIDVAATGPLATGDLSTSPTDPGWSVQYWVDASSASPSYPSETQHEKPQNNRGLALSPTNQFLYAGYNTGHPDGSNGEVRKIDTTKTDPLDQTAVVASLLGFRGKAIAVDDKGRVYLAEGLHENNDTLVPDTANRLVIYDSNLATQLFNFTIGGTNCPGTTAGNDCLPANARPEGVAVVRFDSTHLTLYVSDRVRNTLTQFTLTESGPGITFATFDDEVIVPGASDMRGVEVDKSGRIWIADPEGNGGGVFILNNTLTFNTFVSVPTAMDVGFDNVNAFVTQGPNPSGSTITVLSQTTFAPVTTLTPPYSSLNINPTVNGVGEEPRLSGIALACPLFGCTTPGFYVANEAAWEVTPDFTETPPLFNREPIIRANAGTFTPCLQGCGKVTGGGQIKIGTSGKATYGFNVQVKNGVAKGQLEYLDHSTGADYHSIKMMTLTVSPDFKTADFTGTIKKKGNPATYNFKVHVEDHGEPGRNDKFEITISDGYAAGQGQKITKGNIQIHRKCD